MKILVISLAGIGDTLLATPLIHALRLRYPKATIDAVVMYPASRDILENNPNINTIHFQHLVTAGARANLRFIRELRKQRYDISINTYPQSKIQYRIIARLIGAPLRLSHRHENCTWFDSLLINRFIEQDYKIHCVENNLNLLHLVDADFPRNTSAIDCELFPSPAEIQRAHEFLTRPEISGRTLVAIQVGSGKTKNLILKRWPVPNYIEVIRKLLETHQETRVVLFGGPEEVEDNQQVLEAIRDPRVLPAGTRSIKEAAALLKHCHVFLSVDNAFMHLSAAMKVPEQVVIESPTFNKTIEPWRNKFRLVPNPMVAGRNLEYYLYDGRDVQGTTEHLLECMRSITPDAVLKAMEEALADVQNK